MFTITNLVQPDSLEEAYKILIEKKANTILGGCGFLRMGSKRIGTAIELSKLNLNYINEEDDYIEIGAYTTFRDLETSPLLNVYFGGVIPRSIKDILGIQFRSIATVGASVFSKYGFSDLIPTLLTLDCEVELFKAGRMTLEDFINRPYEKDILTKIHLKKSDKRAVYNHLRNSISDFSILNVAVSKLDNKFIVSVGARPAFAKIAKKTSEYLSCSTINEATIAKAAIMASEEIGFGDNMRGSKDYRKAMCSVLVKRSLQEVSECR